MIPRIYDKTFTSYESNGLGLLRDVIECYVEEESNGTFELFIEYPVDSFLYEYIQRENIIKADASKSLKGQLFRIYYVSKPLDGVISAYARHITFDLANDTLNEDINLQDMTCQGAGNSMLSKGDFSSKFTIHSDIEMVGNYSMDRKTDCLSAIAGTRGSLIDTFGNGPKILRDNFDIHILKRRESDNNTLIAYGKNLTGFELEEDDSDLITRIKPYATYADDAQNSHTVYGMAVDSSRIDSYSVIRSVWMDFSEEFEEGEEITQDKLRQMAVNYFADNNCDLPKMTYKVEFELLAQTEEYKDYKMLEDIDMDDGVYIVNSKYGIRDQAKVIKTKYNPIAEKYISIELGDPRTTLGSIINKDEDTVTKDEVQDMIDNSNTEAEFPDDLPDIPVVNIDRAGFKTISLSWSFNSEPHYTYELYASQERGFTPSTYDLIYAGKGSSFLHDVDCSQTWYYKARAVNTYDHATEFSEEVSATTTKISDAAEYFEEAAIESALIGDLNADKITSGTIKGDYIDAKNLKIVDGNGNITLYVSSDGTIQNMTLYKREDDGTIVGKIELSAQGINILDSNGDIASYFKTDSSYVKYLAAEIVKAGNLVMDVTATGMSNNLYVVSEETTLPSDNTNYFYGIQEAIDYIYNNGKYLSEDITINLEDNLNIIESNLYIPDFMGSGRLTIKFGSRTHITLLGSIVVDNCAAEILFTSNKTYGNINEVDYYDMINNGLLITNKEAILKGFGHGKITLDSLRLRSYLESSTGCVDAYDNCNVIVQNCDIKNFRYVGYVDNGGEFRIHNSCGIADYIVHGWAGGKAFIPEGIIPLYSLTQYLEHTKYDYYVNTTSASPTQATTVTYVETAPNGETGGIYDCGKFSTSTETTGLSKMLKHTRLTSYSAYDHPNYGETHYVIENQLVLGHPRESDEINYNAVAEFGDISYLATEEVTVNKVTLFFTSNETINTNMPHSLFFKIIDSNSHSECFKDIFKTDSNTQKFEYAEMVFDLNVGSFNMRKGTTYKIELTNNAYIYDNEGNQIAGPYIMADSSPFYAGYSSMAEWFNAITDNFAVNGKFDLALIFRDNVNGTSRINLTDIKLKIEYTDTQVSVGTE